MSNVTRLPGVAQTLEERGNEPCRDTIERLERMLDEAKSGELQYIMYTTLYSDRAVARGWTSESFMDTSQMLGAFCMLQAEISSRHEELSE